MEILVQTLNFITQLKLSTNLKFQNKNKFIEYIYNFDKLLKFQYQILILVHNIKLSSNLVQIKIRLQNENFIKNFNFSTNLKFKFKLKILVPILIFVENFRAKLKFQLFFYYKVKILAQNEGSSTKYRILVQLRFYNELKFQYKL